MSYRFRLSAVIFVSLVLLYGDGLYAVTIHVPVDHATIQGAIDAAVNGDEVVVAPGTYVESINFNGKAITVRSSSDDPEDTIIDADGAGSVVTCDSGETATTVLQGFTLTGGNSTYGGGMHNDDSSPTVINCTFSENEASYGGGMYNVNSSPTVTDCIFSGNTASENGGGMYNYENSSPTVTNCTFSGNTTEHTGGKTTDTYRGFVTNTRAENWEAALVSGNGVMGATVMGNPNKEVIYVSHERLYLPSPYNLQKTPDMAKYLPQLRKILAQGKYSEAAGFWNDMVAKEGGPTTMLYTDPFIPAFNLNIEMNPAGEVADYARSIDFETGQAKVVFKDDRGQFTRRLFVSRPDNIIVLSIKGPGAGELNCELSLKSLRPMHYLGGNTSGYATERERVGEGFRRISSAGGNDWLSYSAAYEKENGGYDGIARVACKGGTCYNIGESISIEGADEVLVMLRVEYLPDADKSKLTSMLEELNRFDADYDKLLARHAEVHGEIFNRVRLDLGGGKDRSLTTEALIEKARQTSEIPAVLLEKIHDFGRYSFISSSGQLPPNLQGVWTGTWNPGWSSDYTLDLNLQLSVALALPGNMPEALEGYFNFVEELIPDMQKNAKMYFGCRGVLTPARAVPKRALALHRDYSWPLEFWTAGAAWLANTFYDYYLYTGDKDFLAKRAVPYMKEVALFYEDFLTVTDENGKYIFTPSYSPENTPGNSNHQATVNATMDISASKELLTNLIASCNELNIEQEGIEKWQKMLSKIPDYMVNEDGAIKEWAHPDLADNYHHRHLSHLYSVWPALEANEEDSPELFKACIRAAEMRMTDGIANMSLHSLGQMALISARLNDSELIYAASSKFVKQHLGTNMFGYGWNVGDTFQMDGTLIFPAALTEMLVYSRPGIIEFLPALPEKLPKGSVTGILCRGRIEMKNLQWDMTRGTVNAVLTSAVTQEITVKLPKEIDSIKVTKGGGGLGKSPLGPRYWKLSLPAGDTMTLNIALK